MDAALLVEEHWCPTGGHWWRCDLYYLESAFVYGLPYDCPFPLALPCGHEESP